MLPRWFKNGTLLPTTQKTNKQIKTFSHYGAWSYVFYVLKKKKKKHTHQLPPHRYGYIYLSTYLERSQPGWDIRFGNRIIGEKVKTLPQICLSLVGQEGPAANKHTLMGAWEAGQKTLLGRWESESCSVVSVQSMEFSRPAYWSVGSCSLLQGIFPTHGLNTGLPHCR